MKERMRMADAEKLVGFPIVLFRNQQKQAAKVLKVDMTEMKIQYELLTNPDKGKRFVSRFDPNATVDRYDKESEILALLEA